MYEAPRKTVYPSIHHALGICVCVCNEDDDDVVMLLQCVSLPSPPSPPLSNQQRSCQKTLRYYWSLQFLFAPVRLHSYPAQISRLEKQSAAAAAVIE